MSKKFSLILTKNKIQNRIYTIRNVQVMIDRDLAELYGVETRVLNQATKRNKERFPARFMFKLTTKEVDYWKSQIVISNREIMGLRKTPYAFTEQGVAMLSTVLKSKAAVEVSIKIMDAFVSMRKFITSYNEILPRLGVLEKRQLTHEVKTYQKFERIFKALEGEEVSPKQGIFFDGQIFDAYTFVSNIIRKAKKSIILMDNYVDDTVLTLLAKRRKGVDAVILTKAFSKQLKLDLEKHNAQYAPIEAKIFKKAHDRFLIVDKKNVYHIGASLKDLGQKWFAFSKIEKNTVSIMSKIK